LRKITAIGLLLLLVCSFSGLVFSQEEPVKVSLEDILGAPDKYNGKLIETRGFLLQEFENSALYANVKWQYAKGIWITATTDFHISRDEVNRRYVIVTGLFDSNDHGHLGSFRGTLKVQKLLIEETKQKYSSQKP
jgi:hypothetical protein